MARVDPFITPLPRKLALDQEVGPFFRYWLKHTHDMWKRTGAGEDLIEGGAQLTANQEFSGSNTFSTEINLDAIPLKVDGVQVVTAQQAAVADAAGATATNPAPPAAYTAHASGAVPVTSNAATDLNTTAAALATLRGEVASYETTISALIVDQASLRTQLNLALAAMRAHGLIDT